MAKYKRDEIVSVSFHYMDRKVVTEGNEPKRHPFSPQEFEYLCAGITNQKAPDLTIKEQFDSVKFGKVVPFSKLTQVDKRCIFGVYEGAYWGHSYKNSEKGDISAESINQRRFNFMLYLSESGRIYIASQYLGLYGFYDGLKKTILNLLPSKKGVEVHTFRQDAIDYSKAVAKEVKVSISSAGDKITSDNLFSSGSMVAVKKRTADDGFEEEVRKSILSLISSPLEKKKKAIADLLKKSLIDVPDEEIENCTVLASIGKVERIIYVLGGSDFASRFPIDVEIKYDGHPDYDSTMKAMYDLLAREIIARKEDV